MSKHTVGPWRWEFNEKHKSMTLVGGKPKFDLTIMDFARWGMGGAVAVMRDTAHDGFNIMHRVCDRPDWITPFEGRKHHADWCAEIIHPDMRLIAAAPDLLKALEEMIGAWNMVCDVNGWERDHIQQQVDACKAVAKAKGQP